MLKVETEINKRKSEIEEFQKELQDNKDNIGPIIKKYKLDQASPFTKRISTAIKNGNKEIGEKAGVFEDTWKNRKSEVTTLDTALINARKTAGGHQIWNDTGLITACEVFMRDHEKTWILYKILPTSIKEALNSKRRGELLTSNSEMIQVLEKQLHEWEKEKIHTDSKVEKEKIASESKKEIDGLNKTLSKKEIELQTHTSGIILKEKEEIIETLIKEKVILQNENFQLRKLGPESYISQENQILRQENEKLNKSLENSTLKINELTENISQTSLKVIRLEEGQKKDGKKIKELVATNTQLEAKFTNLEKMFLQFQEQTFSQQRGGSGHYGTKPNSSATPHYFKDKNNDNDNKGINVPDFDNLTEQVHKKEEEFKQQQANKK